LEATNCHSIEWTQVRSRIHKDKEQKKILKLLGSWKVIQDTKWVRNLEVTPKDAFAYLDKTCHMLGHPKMWCTGKTQSGIKSIRNS
jgi:hypothetical protein